jgi:hypothetical protein
MRNSKITVYRPRNPETHAKHRHEVLVQIMIPVVLAVLILLGLGVGSALMPSDRASLWADISLIWLIPGAMLFTLVGLALFGGLAYVTIKLIDVLPFQFYRLHHLLRQVHHGVVKVSEKITEPIFRIKMYRAGTKAFVEQMRPSRRNNR